MPWCLAQYWSILSMFLAFALNSSWSVKSRKFTSRREFSARYHRSVGSSPICEIGDHDPTLQAPKVYYQWTLKKNLSFWQNQPQNWRRMTIVRTLLALEEEFSSHDLLISPPSPFLKTHNTSAVEPNMPFSLYHDLKNATHRHIRW